MNFMMKEAVTWFNSVQTPNFIADYSAAQLYISSIKWGYWEYLSQRDIKH